LENGNASWKKPIRFAGNERTAEGSAGKHGSDLSDSVERYGMRRRENQTQGNEVWNVSKARKGRLDGAMIVAESRFSSPVPALNRRPRPLLKCWCRRPGLDRRGQALRRSREFCAGGLPGVQRPPGRGRCFFPRFALPAKYSLVQALLLRAEGDYFQMLPPCSFPSHRSDGMQSVFVNTLADMSTHSPVRRQQQEGI